MFGWKEKRIGRYVQNARAYIDDLYYDVHYSIAEDDDEEEEPIPSTSSDGPKYSSRPKYSRRDYGDTPGSDIKYSERDYGDYPRDDDFYSAFRSVLRSHPNASLEMLNRYVSPTFVDTLLRYIDQKHLKDSQVYKAAGVDRRLYSKIISDRTYKPARDTCIALCIGLRLNLEDASELLEKAGYTLSHSNKRDLAIEFFLVEGIYQLQEINEVLDRLGLKILGRE